MGLKVFSPLFSRLIPPTPPTLNCIIPAFCSYSFSNFYWVIKQWRMLFEFTFQWS